MMNEYSFLTLNSSGFSEVWYSEWGSENEQTLVCVHGLTGSAADFKFVGEYMSRRGYRVVAIDLPGRGRSDALQNPEDYCYAQYFQDLSAFLAHIGCSSPACCDWLGASLGGLLGIPMAALPNSPIRRLILSDIGPHVPVESLNHIRGYLSLSPVFDTLDGVIGAFKQSKGTGFYRGPMTEDQWAYYASTHVRQRSDGAYIRNFDPAIAMMFDREPLGHVNLWEAWKSISQPVLSIRGELSLLFPDYVAKDMTVSKIGAPVTCVTIPDCGHVPSLYPDNQVELFARWLMQHDGAAV